MTPLDFALVYAKRGWHVFPVEPKGKAPITPNGVKDATTDPEQIAYFWGVAPFANIAIATGASNLVVVDFDDLEAAFHISEKGLQLPNTLAAETAKGYHFYYTSETFTKPMVGRLPYIGEVEGVDVRAGNSYVVAPPSIHETGVVYKWVTQYHHTPQPLPEWFEWAEPQKPKETSEVIHLDRYAAAAMKQASAAITGAKEGTRNHTLNREAYGLAKNLVDRGLASRGQIEQVLIKAAFAAGLDEEETAKTLESAFKAAGIM